MALIAYAGRGDSGCVESDALTELERAQLRISQLEEMIGLKPIKPFPWFGAQRATPNKVLNVLLKRGSASREFLFQALYGDRAEGDTPTNTRTVDQHICRLNKALKETGVKIKTDWNHGYYLSSDDRRKLQELIDNS